MDVLCLAGHPYATAMAMGDFYDEAMKEAIAKTKKLEDEYAEKMKAKKVRLFTFKKGMDILKGQVKSIHKRPGYPKWPDLLKNAMLSKMKYSCHLKELRKS